MVDREREREFSNTTSSNSKLCDRKRNWTKLIKRGMMSGSGAIGGQMAVTSSPHPLLATDVSVSVLSRPHCALSYSLISAYSNESCAIRV